MHSTIQPLSDANHICQTFQVGFDRMLCEALEKYYSSPGFTLPLSPSYKAGRIGYFGFSFSFDGGSFIYDPSLGRWAYY